MSEDTKLEKEEKKPKKADDLDALKALIEAQNEKIALLERAAKGEAITLTEPEFRECIVKFVGDEPVVDWGKSELRGADAGAKNLFIQLFTVGKDGEEHEHWVSAHDVALELKSEKGRIIDEKRTKVKKNYGMVDAKEVDGYRTIMKGYKVPLDVVSEESVYTVELEGGRTFKARKLNV